MEQAFMIGERLYLRPLELEHNDLVRGWLNDPRVRRTVDRNAPLTHAEEEKFLREGVHPGERRMLMVLREGDRPIGVIGLHQPDRVHRRVMLGLLIGEVEEWGKGYAGEAIGLMLDHAFDELGLHRVLLHAYAFNTRGLRVYEKLGFVREGVLREDHFAEGRFHDTIVMGLLAREWWARRRPS